MNGGNLYAKHVVHAVAPRYQPKYKTAAEHALHKCYRNVLALAREKRLKTIAIPPIHKKRRESDHQYPRHHAAHCAARTIRRCLEKWGDTLERVAIVPSQTTAGMEDLRHLLVALPLYFPRNKEEAQQALTQLPSNTGNVDGELILHERTIKIAAALGIEAEVEELSNLEDEREKLVGLQKELTSLGKHTEAANALAKERVVAAKIHRLRAVIDAQQALPTKETSKLYSSGYSSKDAKKYTSHLVSTGFAQMRSEPEPEFDEESVAALNRSRSVTATKKTIVRAASGKLPRIKEGTLQKKGLRTKLWSDRLVVLTKDVLAYSHTVRKTGGVIQVARINKVVAFKSDGYFGVFVEEPGKVHMFRCLDQVEMQEWHRQLQVVAHLQTSEIRTANKVIKEGELEKRGKKSRLWMKRRVYITGSEFRYSHGFFGDKKASIIPTNYVNKITYQEYGGLCGFELRCDQGHEKIQEVVTFRTRQPGQITEWLNALSTATGQPITGATDSIAGYIGSDAAAAAAEAPSLPFEDRDITYGEATL